MTKAQKINWQPLSMIPLFLEIATGMLDSAQDQLGNLEQVEHKPHVLDDEIIRRLSKLYPEQKEDIPFMLEQCQRWEKETGDFEQIKKITSIKNALRKLQITIEKILPLVDYCKDRTINKIMEKDDFELALDFLTGKSDLSLDGKL